MYPLRLASGYMYVTGKPKSVFMEQPEYGSFAEYFDIGGQSVYFSIHPEMSPGGKSIVPTGRYFVYCIHPELGSCHFMIQQDEHDAWDCEHHPPFIDQNFITWIGERIESKKLSDI